MDKQWRTVTVTDGNIWKKEQEHWRNPWKNEVHYRTKSVLKQLNEVA